MTDANLLLGRLQPDFFPHIFGKTENMPLDLAGTTAAFDALTAIINAHGQAAGQPLLTAQDVALGFVRVANEAMWFVF